MFIVKLRILILLEMFGKDLSMNITGPEPHQCLFASTWIEMAPVAMLAAKRSVGVGLEVSLRNPLHADNKACRQENQPWLWNPGQTSPEVQRGVSVDPQKWLMSCKKIINITGWGMIPLRLRLSGSDFALTTSWLHIVKILQKTKNLSRTDI